MVKRRADGLGPSTGKERDGAAESTGGGATLLVTNLGPQSAIVLLGSSTPRYFGRGCGPFVLAAATSPACARISTDRHPMRLRTKSLRGK